VKLGVSVMTESAREIRRRSSDRCGIHLSRKIDDLTWEISQGWITPEETWLPLMADEPLER